MRFAPLRPAAPPAPPAPPLPRGLAVLQGALEGAESALAMARAAGAGPKQEGLLAQAAAGLLVFLEALAAYCESERPGYADIGIEPPPFERCPFLSPVLAAARDRIVSVRAGSIPLMRLAWEWGPMRRPLASVARPDQAMDAVGRGMKEARGMLEEAVVHGVGHHD